MSEQSRDRKTSEQDILKIFEESDEPFMTASEVAAELPVSRQAVNYRLDKMHEKGLVGKKKTGASSVGWWAKVAPRLADDHADRVRDSEAAFDRGDAVALEDV